MSIVWYQIIRTNGQFITEARWRKCDANATQMWRLRKKRSFCRFHSTSTISWLLLSQLTTNRCERERTSKNKLARFAIWKTLFLNFLKGPSKLLWRALCSSQVKVIAHSWLLSCKIIAEHHFGAGLKVNKNCFRTWRWLPRLTSARSPCSGRPSCRSNTGSRNCSSRRSIQDFQTRTRPG